MRVRTPLNTRQLPKFNTAVFIIGAIIISIALTVGLSVGLTVGLANPNALNQIVNGTTTTTTGTLLTTTTINTGPTNAPIAPSCFDSDFVCPTNFSLVTTGFPASAGSGKCFAFNPTTQLFYVLIRNATNANSIYTWSEETGLSADFLSMGILPGAVFGLPLNDCIYYEAHNKIYLRSFQTDWRLISIDVNTWTAVELFALPGATIRGFVIHNDKFFSIADSGVYEFNSNTGAILNTYANPFSSQAIVTATVDYSTNRTIAIAKKANGLPSTLDGTLLYDYDIENETFFPSCLSFGLPILVSGGRGFDSKGWFYFSGGGSAVTKLFAIQGSPMYRTRSNFNFTGANFTLTCPDPYFAFPSANISSIPNAITNVRGCDGELVESVNSQPIDSVTIYDNVDNFAKREMSSSLELHALSNTSALHQEVDLQPIFWSENATDGKRSPYQFPSLFYNQFSDVFSDYPGPASVGIAASANKWVTVTKNPSDQLVALDSARIAFVLSTMVSAPCNGVSSYNVIRFDVEILRWVIVWVVSPSNVCFLISNTINHLGTYTHTVFDFPGQDIRDLQFSIWGDYYVSTWNNVNLAGASGDSICNVWERDRFINGGGMPRVVQIVSPSIVSTDGYRATSGPLHQPVNNGPRSPVQQAFPCGIFVGMTANSGGVLNMRMCQSVDFDTSMTTILDSRTTIGTYNDGTSGTCASETECVQCTSGFADPYRYYTATAYRSFPSKNYEKLAVAITVDSDGTQLEKIRWGEFLINTDGSLSGGPMYISDNSVYNDLEIGISARPIYLPSLLYDVTELLMMAMRTSTASFIQGRFPGSPAGVMSQLLNTNIGPYCVPNGTFPIAMASAANKTTNFIFAQHRTSQFHVMQYGIRTTSHTIRSWAVDSCCNVASCDQQVTFNWNGFIFPQP